jgi:hypothetical protein
MPLKISYLTQVSTIINNMNSSDCTIPQARGRGRGNYQNSTTSTRGRGTYQNYTTSNRGRGSYQSSSDRGRGSTTYRGRGRGGSVTTDRNKSHSPTENKSIHGYAKKDFKIFTTTNMATLGVLIGTFLNHQKRLVKNYSADILTDISSGFYKIVTKHNNLYVSLNEFKRWLKLLQYYKTGELLSQSFVVKSSALFAQRIDSFILKIVPKYPENADFITEGIARDFKQVVLNDKKAYYSDHLIATGIKLSFEMLLVDIDSVLSVPSDRLDNLKQMKTAIVGFLNNVDAFIVEYNKHFMSVFNKIDDEEIEEDDVDDDQNNEEHYEEDDVATCDDQ